MLELVPAYLGSFGDRRSCSECLWCPGLSMRRSRPTVLLGCDAVTVSSMMAYVGRQIANISDIADMPRAARMRRGLTGCCKPTATSISTATTSTRASSAVSSKLSTSWVSCCANMNATPSRF